MKLKEYRVSKGISRAFVSKETSIDYQRLVRLEEDERTEVRLDELQRLAKVYGLNLEDMIEIAKK